MKSLAVCVRVKPPPPMIPLVSEIRTAVLLVFVFWALTDTLTAAKLAIVGELSIDKAPAVTDWLVCVEAEVAAEASEKLTC